MARKIVITNNQEIYKKMTMLHFSPEVLLKDIKKPHIDRIINNINKKDEKLMSTITDEGILIKKLKPINFDVYLTKALMRKKY